MSPWRAVPVLLLLAGCTFDSDVNWTGSISLFECVDTRDGETFRVREQKPFDGEWGIGAKSCASLFDTDGRLRRVCSGDEAWLKCTPLVMDTP